jgi:hypothetical protein
MNEEAVSSKCPCDHDRHNRHWKNTKDYQVEYCHYCGRIFKFHWKSLWKRIKDVFINETLN